MTEGHDPLLARLKAALADRFDVQREIGALPTLFDDRLSTWARAAAQPPSYEAYQEYIQGMTCFKSWARPAVAVPPSPRRRTIR